MTGEDPKWLENGKCAHFQEGKEDVGNYRSAASKVMEKIILEDISTHTKDKKVIWNSRYRFNKENLQWNGWQWGAGDHSACLPLLWWGFWHGLP